MSQVLDSSFLRTLLQVVSPVVLISITAFLWPIFFGSLGPGSEYRIVVLAVLTLSYLLILPSLLLAMAGRTKSQTLRLGVALTSAIAIIALTILAIGYTQDLTGARCEGFFGSTQSCVDSAWLWVFVALMYPPIFIVVTLAIIGLLTFGLVDEYRKSQSGKKASVRKR